MFVNIVKNVIQNNLRKFGWEINRFRLTGCSQLSRELNERNVGLVLDVGANVGQFASSLFAAGYLGEIVSFEPVGESYKRLVKTANINPRWQVAPQMAIGSKNGGVEINISKNSVSSSILPILSQHVTSAPESNYYSSEKVLMKKLDSWVSDKILYRPFLKIDTQGYELEVIKGASGLLNLASGIKLEISIAKLYEGQPDYIHLISRIRKLGFELWSLEPGFSDSKTGQLLQFDALFFRVE